MSPPHRSCLTRCEVPWHITPESRISLTCSKVFNSQHVAVSIINRKGDSVPYVHSSIWSRGENKKRREEKEERKGGQGSAPRPRLENFRQMRQAGVELIDGKDSAPFSPWALPLHTQIRFPYILSTAYHVIVETYTHWRKCADMCAGPGSTGRVRDTRCTEKNSITSSPPSLLSPSVLL